MVRFNEKIAANLKTWKLFLLKWGSFSHFIIYQMNEKKTFAPSLGNNWISFFFKFNVCLDESFYPKTEPVLKLTLGHLNFNRPGLNSRNGALSEKFDTYSSDFI